MDHTRPYGQRVSRGATSAMLYWVCATAPCRHSSGWQLSALVVLQNHHGGCCWCPGDIDIWVRDGGVLRQIQQWHEECVVRPLRLRFTTRMREVYTPDEGADTPPADSATEASSPSKRARREDLIEELHRWHARHAGATQGVVCSACAVVSKCHVNWPRCVSYNIIETCSMHIDMGFQKPTCVRGINLIHVELISHEETAASQSDVLGSFIPDEPVLPQMVARKHAFAQWICAGFDMRMCSMYLDPSGTSPLKVCPWDGASGDALNHRIVLQPSAFVGLGDRSSVDACMQRLQKYTSRGFVLSCEDGSCPSKCNSFMAALCLPAPS